MSEGKSVASDKEWERFKKKFLTEMRSPNSMSVIALLAALSHQTNFSIGCYREDERRCHRSILKELLVDQGAVIVGSRGHSREPVSEDGRGHGAPAFFIAKTKWSLDNLPEELYLNISGKT